VQIEDLEEYLFEPDHWFNYELPSVVKGLLQQHLQHPSGAMALGHCPGKGFFVLGLMQKPFIIWRAWDEQI